MKINYLYCFIIVFFIDMLFSVTDFTHTVKLDVYSFNKAKYILYDDFVAEHQLRNNYYPSKDKYEIIYQKNKIYLSPFSTFCKINNNIYQMQDEPIYKKNQLYIPVESFYKILSLEHIPIKIFDISKKELLSSTILYNINNIAIDNKQNGTLISLQTNKMFSSKDISVTSITDRGWLSLTVLNGSVDSIGLANASLEYPVKEIKSIQTQESSQIAFKLSGNYEKTTISTSNNSINILLQRNIADNIDKLKDLKERWMINTIVIDAGHGGKDPGCSGYNINEKDITLDIAKKLGTLLEQRLNVNIIYTREEDVFIPLWKRTQIANSNDADLFISIHANAVSKHQNSTYGFETYLVSMDKTARATETVQRENGVIQLEKKSNKYTTDFSTSTILPKMIQNANMKTSEQLAILIQEKLSQNINSKNRGVKQAGFQVLWGATMPNVLIEVGFLTHPKESKKLNNQKYRAKIAESLYDAIKEFKSNYEKNN
tara:strand:- start:1403 stop:2860 length:1458 start_codon:yes stop_codon:yes gene_type:complete